MRKHNLVHILTRVMAVLFLSAIVGWGYSQTAPSWTWTQVVSGSNFGGFDECPVGWDIATDGQKNSFVIGTFSGIINLGSQTLTSVGSADIFIGKVNSSGQWIWATQAGGSGLDHGLGIEIDDIGNIFVSGSFKNTATFGSTSLISSGLRDVFIAKLSGQGVWEWAVRAGGIGDDYANKIAVDNLGCSYVTGYYTGSAIFGTTALTSNNYDMFVTKLDTNGMWEWVKSSEGSGSAHGEGITLDESGTVYVSGALSGQVSFGAVNVSVSNSKPFIAKLDNNGIWLFATAPSGTGSGGSMDIEVDTLGNCYIVGGLGYTSNYSITFGSTTIGTGMDRSDGFVAKLSASGSWLWAKQYGGSDWDGGWGIGIDGQGNSYITGFYRQSGYFGSTYLSAGSWNRDIFLAKLDTYGNWQWAIKAGGGGHDTGTDVDTDNNGNCFVTGWYNSSHYDGAQSASIFVGAIVMPDPPSVTAQFPIVQFAMNNQDQSIDLDDYFDSSLPITFTFTGNTMINASVAADKVLNLQPAADWYGTEYITIRATNTMGYVEQVLKVTVIQTWAVTENFNLAGVIPANWTVQNSGTTLFPWQPVLVSGDNYLMKTQVTTGKTGNERLLSLTYNLSAYKEIQVSFETDFLPYSSGTGTFAYTLNNVTYTAIETFSTSTNGIKTYIIPALDSKPSVRFRWIYTNTVVNTGQANYWSVDNFNIYGVVRDTAPPAAITGLSVLAQSSNSVTLGWNSGADVYFDKYELYVSNDAQVTTADQLWSVTQDPLLYNITTTQTTISPFSGGEYWVAIRATDQSGNASALSAAVYLAFDGTAPQISAPIPVNQPEPLWSASRTALIGCTISDTSGINNSSIQYRYDANGNGRYDTDEAWQDLPRSADTRNSLNVSLQIVCVADSVIAFEFKAADIAGNISYSGLSSTEGIADDWVVRIDSTPPMLTTPIPENQPEPSWVNSRTVTIGCTIQDVNNVAVIEYRFDLNGNGIYDTDEGWNLYAPSRQASRNQIVAEVPVTFAADGLINWEFRASDALGNTCYSGISGLEGITDDWIVRVDTTPPVIANPLPVEQPLPAWATNRTVTIGATISDLNTLDLASVKFRYDSNGSGSYDAEEVWTPLNTRNAGVINRDSQSISTQITFAADGIFAFEFTALDTLGNIAYSGSDGAEGIADDWIVRIDTTPPQLLNPIPTGQPLPAWHNTLTVLIGATITDSVAIDVSSIRYRIDQNKNGIYDGEENWLAPGRLSRSESRNSEISFQVEIQAGGDGVYKYEIKASDLNGVTGYSGTAGLEGIADDWMFRIDTTAPAAISNFFVETVSDNTIQLTWTASSDVNFAGYRLNYALNSGVSSTDALWDAGNDANLTNQGSGMISTTITGLTGSTRYYFLLRAIDEVGWEFQYPLVISAMTSSSGVPIAPQNVTIMVVGTQLILDWDDVTTDVDNNPIEVSGYNVYVGDNPSFACNFDSLITTTNESVLVLDGVVDTADRLFFKVIAVSGAIRARE